MALTAYITACQNLIQAPSSPVPLISGAQWTTYINTARNQVAADAECIRQGATLALAAGTPGYAFSAITTGNAAIGSVITVRSARIFSVPLDIRGWEWFAQYYLGDGTTGIPVRMAQQGQGTKGTLNFNPIPNAVITVSLDVVCLPVPLADDTTVEAIPGLFTDAVPFYAAWLAMQSMQRQSDANMMYVRYKDLIQRGRQLATPSELPINLPGGAGAQAVSSRQTLAGKVA